MRSERQGIFYCFPILMLSIFLVIVAFFDQALAETRSFDPPITRALQKVLDNALIYLGMPGAIVMIKAPDNALWIGTGGISRITANNSGVKPGDPGKKPWQGQPVRPEMYFRIASNTKTFTSVIILQLAGEGRLKLKDSVHKWLGDLVPQSREISIRNLLNMTSGLYNYPAYEPFFADSLSRPLKGYTPRQLIEVSNIAGKGKLNFKPGADWEYCNTNYILLGMIIEKITGRKFRQEIARRIAEPLGLSHTFAPKAQEVDLPAPHMHGYCFLKDTYDSWQDMSVQNVSGSWSAGNLVSNANDMMIWIDKLVSGVLLKEPFNRLMFDWVSTKGRHEARHYGLGIMQYHGAVGHIGSILGFRSCIFKYKEHLFVIFLNGYRTVTDHKGHYALYVFRKVAETLGLFCDTAATIDGSGLGGS